MRRLLGLIGVASTLCASALGQGPGPGTDPSHTVSFGSAKVGSVLVNLIPGQKVSGSGVEFGLRLKMLPSANYGQLPTIHSIYATQVKISMNGGFGEMLNENEIWTSELDFQPTFRFTSTAFNHNADIEIRIEINYVLEAGGGTSYLVEYVHTYTVKAHNVLQNLGNHMNSATPPAESAAFRDDSDKTTISAAAKLVPAHQVIPGATAQEETKASILFRLLQATVFCASTHGGVSTLFDSDSSELVYFDEMGQRLGEKPAAGIPKLNLVALWACSSGSDGAANALGVGNSAVNRALVGFAQDVSILAYTRAAYDDWDENGIFTWPSAKLSDHANVFWGRMKAGDTVVQALANCVASYAVMPSSLDALLPLLAAGADGPAVDEVFMDPFGDPLTRLYYVYLTLPQWNAGVNPFKNWVRLDIPLGEQ